MVEQNNAVPIPQTTAAAPALPLETELYTETYTEVVHETVLSSDTEGTIPQRQGRPLTGPVAEVSVSGINFPLTISFIGIASSTCTCTLITLYYINI